jgi:hypothetical protein
MLFYGLTKLKSVFKIYKRLFVLHNDSLYRNRANELNNSVLYNKESGVTNEKYCGAEVIISLTTHNIRLYEVYITIESLMQQTRKANRIVLWISEEYKNEPLPNSLKTQQLRGLEIRYCKDIRSYTKLIPALKTFPNDIIITVDDDVLYDVNLVDRLTLAYMKDKSKIHYCRGHVMKLSSNNSLKHYHEWEHCSSSTKITHLNFPTGIGGVLYPPRCFNQEVFNEEVFLNICKFADDVWFKAMALYNGTLSQKVYTSNDRGVDFLENVQVQDIGLKKINTRAVRQNDIQIKDVFDKYNLYQKLL